MPEEIVMPRLSDTMEEGTVARWLKKEGEPIKKGEPILEVETDKATMELPAYSDGVLAKILVQEGTTVPLGAPIGMLAKPGEEVPAGNGPAQAPTQQQAPAPPEQAQRDGAPGGGTGREGGSARGPAAASSPTDEGRAAPAAISMV